MKLLQHAQKHLTLGIFITLSIWVIAFYAFIVEEVYDNIDDGLKNIKLEIIKKAYFTPEIKDQNNDLSIFQITAVPKGDYPTADHLETIMEYLPYDAEMQPMRVLTTYFQDKNNQDYQLVIKTSTIENDELLQDFTIAVLILYLMLLISIFFINKLVITKLWKDFHAILHSLHAYNLNTPIKSTTKTKVYEFNSLQDEINKMIERVEKNFNQQKNFISHAAHELQTPLAIATSKLELLAEDPNNTSSQVEQIASIHRSLNRLIKLNRSLLMLSKIENNQFTDTQKVDFTALIKSSVEEFDDYINYKGLTYTATYAVTPFIMQMNKGLAITLINNLLKNTIFHNVPHGHITITVTPTQFTFSNTGLALALDPETMYQRFHRTTTHEQSTGLGLSLVKTIIDYTPALKLVYNFDGVHHFIISKK